MKHEFRMQNGLNATIHRLRICAITAKNIARHCAPSKLEKDVLNPQRELKTLPAYAHFAVRLAIEKETLYLVYLDLMVEGPVQMIVGGLQYILNRTLMVADYVVYRGVAYSTLNSSGMFLLEAIENAVTPSITVLLAPEE
jgi:hypothetical protein